jgi:hypothetical protein
MRPEPDLGVPSPMMIGTDADLPALRALLGLRTVGAVTIGQALHWMNHDELFAAALPLIRPGGGIAVITTGTPLWQQDSAWSRALRRFLEEWTGSPVTAPCGTDAASQQRYRDSLTAAGYDVREASVEYASELSSLASRWAEAIRSGREVEFARAQLPECHTSTLESCGMNTSVLVLTGFGAATGSAVTVVLSNCRGSGSHFGRPGAGLVTAWHGGGPKLGLYPSTSTISGFSP